MQGWQGLLGFLISVNAVAFAEPAASPAQTREFYPLFTTRARTIGPGKIVWQPSPGAELKDYGWISNNVSVGVGQRFEVGIMPLLYASHFMFDFAGIETTHINAVI